MSGQSNAQVYAELSSKITTVSRSAREILAEDQAERDREMQAQQSQPSPAMQSDFIKDAEGNLIPVAARAGSAVASTAPASTRTGEPKAAADASPYCDCAHCPHCGKIVR